MSRKNINELACHIDQRLHGMSFFLQINGKKVGTVFELCGSAIIGDRRSAAVIIGCANLILHRKVSHSGVGIREY